MNHHNLWFFQEKLVSHEFNLPSNCTVLQIFFFHFETMFKLWYPIEVLCANFPFGHIEVFF